METKNARQLYREKKSEVHTHEEILAAFEDNTAIVFELSRERTPSAKSNLLVDGDDLLVTVRHLSKADHEKKEI